MAGKDRNKPGREYVEWLQSPVLSKYRGEPAILPVAIDDHAGRGPATSGQIEIARGSELCIGDRCENVCRNALEYLFEMRQIDALGGALSVRVLSSFLKQLALDCPETFIMVHATPRSFQVMRSLDSMTIAHLHPMNITIGGMSEPELILHDHDQTLVNPKQRLGIDHDPLRYFYGEDPDAQPYHILNKQVAYDAERNLVYEDQQQLFTIATPEPENRDLLEQGKAPLAGIEGTRVGVDGISLESPTIRIDRLSPWNTGFSHTRVGINFTAGGEFVRAISARMACDFGKSLEYFPPEFKGAIRKHLTGS